MKVADVFGRYRQAFRPVVAVGPAFVCPYCLGPTNPDFSQCAGCHRLFDQYHPVAGSWEQVPSEIRGRIVPMTTALRPSPWYTYLLQYKRGYLDAYGPIMAALADVYFGHHAMEIGALLGDDPTCVTVVPSTRGFGFAQQPLVKALSLAPALVHRVAHTLEHVPGEVIARHQYNPDVFRPGPERVSGERVLVLEDAWVTGGKAMSAAGALLREGASAVAVLTLARVVDAGFWPAEHPYRQAMTQPYDPALWPR